MKTKNMRRVSALVIALLLVVTSIFVMPAQTQAAVKAKKITLSTSKQNVYVGKSFTLKVKAVKPANASKAVTYKSNNPEIATVNGKGKVTGKKPGKAVITVSSKTSSKVKAKCTVTVKQQVKKIQTASTLVLQKGKSAVLKYGLSPQNASSKKVKFSTSNKKVAAVNKKGKITAKKAGKATITIASSDGFSKAKVKVTVKKKITAVKKIALSEKSLSMTKGDSTTLKAKVTPAKATSKKVYWVSSNTDVATVSAKGKIKAVENGTAVITAYATDNSGKKAECKVEVLTAETQQPEPAPAPTPEPPVPTPPVPEPPVSEETELALSASVLELKVTQSAQLAAEVKPAGKAVTWTVDNPQVAAVNAGKVTALMEGTAIVTAEADGVTASCTVNVTSNDAKTGNYTYVLDKKASYYNVKHTNTTVSVAKENVVADENVYKNKLASLEWDNAFLKNYWNKFTSEELKKLSQIFAADMIAVNNKISVTTTDNVMDIVISQASGEKVIRAERTDNENGKSSVEITSTYNGNVKTVDVEDITVEKNDEAVIMTADVVSDVFENPVEIQLIMKEDSIELNKKTGNTYYSVMTYSSTADAYIVDINEIYYAEIVDMLGAENVAENMQILNIYE